MKKAFKYFIKYWFEFFVVFLIPITIVEIMMFLYWLDQCGPFSCK